MSVQIIHIEIEAKNGYDRYLEFQFRRTGGFFTALFQEIGKDYGKNLAKLEKGFPEEVDAYKTFTRVGAKTFLTKCTPGHSLIERMRSEL